MNNKLLKILLISLVLSACQREVYQPTETSPTEPEPFISSPQSTLSAPPGLADDDPSEATSRSEWEIQYTAENPVSEPEELIIILQDLYDRFMAQFDRPGWYRFYGSGDLGEQVAWVHIATVETRQFDGLLDLYDYPDLYATGFIWPTAVVGPEGQIGFTQKTVKMDDYYFVERSSFFDILDELDRHLDNVGYFSGDIDGGGQFGHLMLLSAIRGVENPVDVHGTARRDFNFEGWVETYENQPVFMVKTTTQYSGALPVMESGERPVREESYTCFDLQNGGAIATRSDYRYQSGNTDFGDWWMRNYNLVDWFEALPDREQQIYDEALLRLNEYNQRKTQ